MKPVTLNETKHRFELNEDGETAVATYVFRHGVMVIEHVVVPEAQRGRGSASLLAAEVVAHARREEIKIRPQCPFMVAYFKRHIEARDVLE